MINIYVLSIYIAQSSEYAVLLKSHLTIILNQFNGDKEVNEA